MSSKINMLIADDEKIIREGLCSIDWHSLGICEVFLASNGAEALKLFLEKDISIVVTDVKMPVMDGIELGRRLITTDKKVKIVILSGHNDFEYAKEAMKFGAVDYLLKPVNAAELIQTVKKLLLSVSVEKVQILISKKKESLEELKVSLYERDKELLTNYDGLLMHDKLFFYDETIPNTPSGFSPQMLVSINHINLHYREPLTVDSIADVAGRSKNYFSTQFKKELGLSFVDYLNKVRLEHAKILLKSTGYMTYEISELVGYSEYRYFGTLFKKYTGKTPSEYREES